jgi:hypothetical protein
LINIFLMCNNSRTDVATVCSFTLLSFSNLFFVVAQPIAQALMLWGKGLQTIV